MCVFTGHFGSEIDNAVIMHHDLRQQHSTLNKVRNIIICSLKYLTSPVAKFYREPTDAKYDVFSNSSCLCIAQFKPQQFIGNLKTY